MCMSVCGNIYMYLTDAGEVQKRVSDPLGLEFEVIVSYPM